MQTVKTAAIVVLLMTVLYGGYVSLTTPPEPIPPEVAELITIEDDLNIDSGFPDSLALSEIGEVNKQSTALDEVSTSADLSIGENAGGASFADLPAGASSTIEAATDEELTALSVAQSQHDPSPPKKLPAIGDATANIQAAIDRQYPSTGNTIELPDPSSVKFDSSGGTAFRSDAMTDLKTLSPPDAPPELEKSSGTRVADLDTQQNEIAQATAVEPKNNLGLTNALLTADRQYASDLLKEALATLSVFYDTPNISPTQRNELLKRLDPLARQVIYSKRHLLEQPYRVARGEKLIDIAAKFEVPWQLLANINGLRDPVTILPGTELKVVRGPFSAQVDLDQKELTLFLDDLYAGRFPIEIGNDPPPKPGTFMVQDKQTDRTYYATQGAPIPAGDANNPYGGFWIDLGDQLCIHGSPNPTRPTDKGCISLAGDFADDLYGILSQGSSVTIRR